MRLHEKPLRVLLALLERPGELVEREELHRRLWPDNTFVDFDNNLNAAVKKLRDALGDAAESPRFVETVPRRGYRFVAPVRRSGEGARRLWRRWTWGGTALLAAAAVFAFGWALGRGQSASGPPSASVPEGRRLLVVLPFDNLDPDPGQEYFADSLTEEMITHLGRLAPQHLGVISRVSAMTYKGASKTVAEIADELAVGYVLEGSVRRSDDRLRVTAQLIETAGQTHLWAETYDRPFGDVLAVQEEVSARVADALALQLVPTVAGQRSTDPAAYEAFLRGRFEWNRFSEEGYRRAIAAFGEAVERDPAFAAAWTALADAWNLRAFGGEVSVVDAFREARGAADRALELEPGLGPAWASRAFARLYADFDAEGAATDFARAVELAPNAAMTYHWQAGALSVLGRHDEAIAAVRRSLELDPVSLSVMSDLGWYLLFADRPEEGLDECRRTLERDPAYGWAKTCVRVALLMLGDVEGVVDAARRERDPQAALLPPEPSAALAALQREALTGDQATDPFYRATLWAGLGDSDRAFAELERAAAKGDPWLVFLHLDPRLDALHGDPRFEALGRSRSPQLTPETSPPRS